MADDLDRIEAHVVGAVAGGWQRQVVTFRRALLALWSANDGRVTASDVRALASRLDVTPPTLDPTALLLPAAERGNARVKAETRAALGVQTPAILTAAQTKPAEAVREMQRRAGVLDLRTMSGILGVLGPLGKSAADLEAAASYAVHTAANEATIEAARQADADLVFVPERDACLECINRGGDTGDAATGNPPPVHPRCRCELQEFNDPEVPKALKRESIRSVLRGFSLPSESEAARLRAAAEMLRRRPVAPKSVQDYARAAIKRGKFGRGRRVPGRRK